MADKFMALKSADSSAAVMRRVEKAILLQQLDTQWKDHLQTLDHLRQGINLRAFGQRDPLNEYKAEAFSYFQDMMDRLREGVTQTLSLVTIDEEKGALGLMPRANFDNIQTNEDAIDQQTAPQQKSPMASITPIRKEFDQNDPTTWGKTPRNALCPCGSGKKYKHCHGLLVAQG
jgi:preprotein translocase subunit SecA